MADKPSLGKTRAGTKADPFPWEEALEAQLGRTKKRLKGLVTDPKQELLNITRQYLPSPTDAPEERDRKLEELALGLTGTPIKGVKPYGVAQEGAFYRVSPEIARRNAARTRGNLEPGGESSEVAGGAPRGDVPELFSGQTYQELTGSQNFPLEVADLYSRQKMSRPYSLPSMAESSLAKQSAIGKTFELAATDNPQYKKAVFTAYKRKYPKIVEQANAKDYDDLLEKSYLQLAKETEEQFKQLPINMSYHRAGEGNYRSSAEMLHDVHKNRHLYVFQGGDPHDFLNRIDPDTGLNTNEMFRAVHDFFGHAVHGTQFGPKGEELAWLAHSQMYSPLARLAMTSETRGQNSFVNYTPINAELKRAISNIEEELYEARRRGRDADVQRLEQLKSGLFNEFQFAPQKSVLLPPEFTTYTFEGGMPSYIQPLIEPKAGTTTQTPLTHFSTSPDILMTDPRKYGTGIAGEEAARLQGVQGAVRPRTYFYAGEPGAVTPEVGLGPYRYRAEGESLYNLAEDPLSLRTLATEANRIPFTAIANAGTVRGAQAMADLERMIKEYGYEGYLQPGGSAPAAAVFTPKAVQRKANGGLATGGQAFPLQEGFQAEVERRAARPRTRAGVPVEDTNVLGGALRGLANTLGGLAFGRTVGTLGMPADIFEPTAAPGAMIPMFGMAGMPSEISKALVQQFAPKGPDIPAPTSEYLLEKGLEKFKPPQEFEVSAKLGRFMPFDIAEMQAAGRKLKALQPTFTEMMESGLERATEPTRSYVIKPEGGNWVRNAAEKYVEPLRMRMHEKDPVQTIAELETKYGKEAADQMLASGFYPNIREHAAINNFIDKKLTKYIRNEMATPSDPVRLQADQWAETKTKLLADKQKQIDKVQADIQKAQRERNVEPEVLTRSQARLRELQKEKALIENRKGLHYEPMPRPESAREARKIRGVPEVNTAKTQTAKSWEDASDRVIAGSSYREQVPLLENDIYAQLETKTPAEQAAVIRQLNQQSLENLGGEYAVQNPEAFAYNLNRGRPAAELGFDHLIDELRGALSNEALPESLRLTTKTLDKMSVPQAIEHVDKINAWRASQKAEADAARAANQATVVHKEYPEAGLKWVEIKAPDTSTIELPEGVTRTQSSVTQGGLDVPGIGFVQAKWNPETGLDWAEAEEKAKRLLASKPVEDALKYEGEMLKHCVGGYCFDVMEGRSRIFSLRDEAGKPHATIEVEPDARIGFRQGEGPKTSSEDYELRQEWARGVDRGEISENTTFAEWWRSQNNIPEPVRGERIAQIKGESNRAPSKEVEPYVQDFVKSGQWSHVGDISNAGLMQSKNAPWRQRFEEAGIDVPEYFSEKDYQDLVKQYFEKTSTPMDPKFMYETYGIQMTPEGGAPNMADGGAVHPAVEKFAASLPHPAVTEFVAKLADGGGVWKAMVDGKYNTVPDTSDAEKIIQGPAFAEGGGVWEQLVKGAGNA